MEREEKQEIGRNKIEKTWNEVKILDPQTLASVTSFSEAERRWSAPSTAEEEQVMRTSKINKRWIEKQWSLMVAFWLRNYVLWLGPLNFSSPPSARTILSFFPLFISTVHFLGRVWAAFKPNSQQLICMINNERKIKEIDAHQYFTNIHQFGIILILVHSLIFNLCIILFW